MWGIRTQHWEGWQSLAPYAISCVLTSCTDPGFPTGVSGFVGHRFLSSFQTLVSKQRFPNRGFRTCWGQVSIRVPDRGFQTGVSGRVGDRFLSGFQTEVSKQGFPDVLGTGFYQVSRQRFPNRGFRTGFRTGFYQVSRQRFPNRGFRVGFRAGFRAGFLSGFRTGFRTEVSKQGFPDVSSTRSETGFETVS